jgi:hypothetical protein
MMRWLLSLPLLLALVLPARGADLVSRTFPAPAERVWAVTEAVLKNRGWDIDKVDRTIGWITTDSRTVEGEDYGVYAKGTRHRLRVQIKATAADRTIVAVERTVFRRERILWMDKDEPITVSDHTVEQGLLDDIARSL